VSAVGSQGGAGGSLEDALAEKILCAPDVRKEFDWAEVNGVRKVTEIRYTSASVDAELGQTAVLTRAFTYDGGPDFDLAAIQTAVAVT
jgi:hypothetical protein